MHDVILAVTIFHTLSSLTLLLGCAAAALVGPMLRRATVRGQIEQMELDADAILSAPAASSGPIAASTSTRLEVAAVA